MKDINKLINTILVAMSVVVAAIFIFGVFNKKSQPENRTDQSSMREVNTDELTNKYIKELQGKLKQEELNSINQIKKTQQTHSAVKNQETSQ